MRPTCRVWSMVLSAFLLAGCSAADPSPEPNAGSATPSSQPTAEGSASTALSEPAADAGKQRSKHILCHDRPATIVGTAGADRLRGRPGRDVFAGRGGDDTVTDVGEDDVVCAGPGSDNVTSDLTRFAHVIDLGPGDDRIRLAEATNVLGGPGNDRIVIEQGVGNLDGGAGNDYLRAISDKMPSGYPENTPCLDYRRAPHPVRVDLTQELVRGQGRDTVVGFHCVTASPHSDVLVGSESRDGLNAAAGPDLVRAGPGNDSVAGGLGEDRIYLGEGFDYANGEAGRDRLYGEGGPDVLEGWTHSDYLEGGPGHDQVYGAIFCAIGGNSYDTGGTLDGAPDELFGGDGDDYLVGDQGNDRIDGGAGYNWAQPGHRDGRIDWVEDVEHYVNGCLENVQLERPLDPSRVRDTQPW